MPYLGTPKIIPGSPTNKRDESNIRWYWIFHTSLLEVRAKTSLVVSNLLAKIEVQPVYMYIYMIYIYICRLSGHFSTHVFFAVRNSGTFKGDDSIMDFRGSQILQTDRPEKMGVRQSPSFCVFLCLWNDSSCSSKFVPFLVDESDPAKSPKFQYQRIIVLCPWRVRYS